MRGASNVYFPLSVSALSIPPGSGGLARALEAQPVFRNNFGKIDEYQLAVMFQNSSPSFSKTPTERVIAAMHALWSEEGDSGPETVAEQRAAERRAIVEELCDEEDSDFQVARIDPSRIPSAIRSFTGHLVLAERLREVRALRGFTRIERGGGGDAYSADCAPIYKMAQDWLPAIEVRGEGIYFEIDAKRIAEWEARDDVRKRVGNLVQGVKSIAEQQGRVASPDELPSARFILVHTLAHLLINQLSLECGYSSASLRERLYLVDEDTDAGAGFLIYTASPGADGTLGGLVRQGDPELFYRNLKAAVYGAIWCSSDPLCIESEGQGADALNLSACHACCIVSETSCEHRNTLLDRALIIGTPDDPGIGFFNELLERS